MTDFSNLSYGNVLDDTDLDRCELCPDPETFKEPKIDRLSEIQPGEFFYLKHELYYKLPTGNCLNFVNNQFFKFTNEEYVEKVDINLDKTKLTFKSIPAHAWFRYNGKEYQKTNDTKAYCTDDLKRGIFLGDEKVQLLKVKFEERSHLI